MRKVCLLMHSSLDGFVAGPNGEMDWICFDNELAEYVGKVTDDADTALYGRITYDMMESYWPTAAESPTATKHDIEHANWVNNAVKIVFSRSLEKTDWKNTRIIKDNIGLSNLRRQLELLYTDYNLSVQHGDGTFTAVLKINLASHVENKMHHNRR